MGRAVVLPLLIADEASVFKRYPLLRAKAYIRWDVRLTAVVEALNRRLDRRYAEEWIFGYLPSFAGWVWARVLPSPENAGRVHEYTLKWGPWQVDGRLSFKNGEPICLRFGKGPDEHSYPVYLRTNPASYVQYGTGDPPCATSSRSNRLVPCVNRRPTFFHSAATCLHVPARLTRESAKHEGRKPRASERHVVGCCEELGSRLRRT